MDRKERATRFSEPIRSPTWSWLDSLDLLELGIYAVIALVALTVVPVLWVVRSFERGEPVKGALAGSALLLAVAVVVRDVLRRSMSRMTWILLGTWVVATVVVAAWWWSST